MVNGKNVTFRENSMEKSPSPKRFEEPEGMTDIDLRRLSELSGCSDSSMKKFDPNTVRNTLFKILAVFLLVGFGTMVFVLIFRQEPLQKNPRIFNKNKNYPRQEYWNHWNEPSYVSETSQQNDETDSNENSKDIAPQNINFEDDLNDEEPYINSKSEVRKPTDSNSDISKETHLIKHNELQNIDNNYISDNKIHHIPTNTGPTFITDKNSFISTSGNTNSISNNNDALQTSIIDFVSLNLEQLQKCKLEQTVETCCINMETDASDSNSKSCNVQSIVEEIKKREGEFTRVQGNWLRKLLENDEMQEGFINSDAFYKLPNLKPDDIESSNQENPDPNLKSSPHEDFVKEKKLQLVNDEKALLLQFLRASMQDKSLDYRNIEEPLDQIFNKVPQFLNLKYMESSDQQENVMQPDSIKFSDKGNWLRQLMKGNVPDLEMYVNLESLEQDKIDPEELHKFNLIAYKIDVNDPTKMPGFLDDIFQEPRENTFSNIDDNVFQIINPNLLNIEQEDEYDKYRLNNELLNLVNLARQKNKNSNKNVRNSLEMFNFMNQHLNDFNVNNVFDNIDNAIQNHVGFGDLFKVNGNNGDDNGKIQSFGTINLDSSNEKSLRRGNDFFLFPKPRDFENNFQTLRELTQDHTDFLHQTERLFPGELFRDQIFTEIGQEGLEPYATPNFPKVIKYQNIAVMPLDVKLSEHLAGEHFFELVEDNPKTQSLHDNLINIKPYKNPKQPLKSDFSKDPTFKFETKTKIDDSSDGGLLQPTEIHFEKTTTDKVHQMKIKHTEVKPYENQNDPRETLGQNLGPKLIKIEDGLLETFHEVSENIGNNFHKLKEKIAPAIKEIKTNLISNFHDIERKIDPKLEVFKDLPKIFVQGTGKVIEKIKEDIGLVPEDKNNLKYAADKGSHVNINPFNISNRMNSSFQSNNIKDASGKIPKAKEIPGESSNKPYSESDEHNGTVDQNILHAEIVDDMKNLRQTNKAVENIPNRVKSFINALPKNGMILQIVQKNRNSLSPIIINGYNEDNKDDKTEEPGEDNTEDSSYETTTATETTSWSGPFQVTSKISTMETPEIDKVDVELDLKETNVNITYTNPKQVKRQAPDYYSIIRPEQIPYLPHQSEYIHQLNQNNAQNTFDIIRNQQDGYAYNNENRDGHLNRNNHQNQPFRHHGQFDYRGEQEFGLDNQNLRLKMYPGQQSDQHGVNEFNPNYHEQQEIHFGNIFQNSNEPYPHQQYSLNNQGLHVDRQRTEPRMFESEQISQTLPNFGDQLLQQEHGQHFHSASHNVNPPGSKLKPEHSIEPPPVLMLPENRYVNSNAGNSDKTVLYQTKHENFKNSNQHILKVSETQRQTEDFFRTSENKELEDNLGSSPISFDLNLDFSKDSPLLGERHFNRSMPEEKFTASSQHNGDLNIQTMSNIQENKNRSITNKSVEVVDETELNLKPIVTNISEITESVLETESSGSKPILDSKVGNENSRSNNKEDESRLNFEGNKLISQATINHRISAETKMGQFNSASEDIQSSHHSSLNPNFQKQCIPISPPVGSSLSVIQQQIPYQYDPNPKFTQLIPINLPKPQANSFVINPQYTYVTPNVPQGYGTFFSNGQTQMVPQTGPSGQYYICNPISSTSNQVAGIPGVEVRQSDQLLEATFNKKNLTTRESDSCATGHELCADNSKCIKTERICDGEVNCNDGSDEVYCSCKYRLGPSRWCDGYYDCPNGEDEVGCFGCESGFFNCDDWSYSHGSTCIPIHLRCNGISDCPTGVDELECSALLDTIETSEDIFKVSNNAGFLHRNFEGKWYPVCTNPEYWALDACKYETGPSIIPPLTRLVPLEHQYTGEYASAGEDNAIHLATKCLEKRAVYVECPQPTCGIRWLYKNPYRREEVDTSAEEIAARFNLRSKREGNDSNVNNSKQQTSYQTILNDQLSLPEGTLGDGRVVGGRPCQPGAWPWVVSIYKNGAFHCGGVLISDMWLMTASHCSEKYWLYFYEIELGMLRRFSYSPMQQTRYVTDVLLHPGYDRSNLKNDIAMMRLNYPVKFNRYVRPICLPNEYTAGQYYQNGPQPGTICTAVGWGATMEHGMDPDHMREVEVPVLPSCKHKDDEEGNEICAGLMEGGKDACQGDSGGPFLCRNPNMPEQWYLAGIVSHGEGCARPNEPGVYTKVAIYRDWIFENAKDDMLPQRKPLHHCPGYTCKAINKCIPKKRRCDRVIDCLNGDDEIDCEHGNSFSALFKHAMKHMMFSYDGLSRSNVKTPGNPETTEAVPEDTISTTFKMENSPITDTLNGNGFAKDDSSFASPAPISDRDKFISNAEAATATSVDVTTEESVDESPEESISPATVSNKEDATQPAKTDVNSTVMMKPFKGERFLCRKMLEVIPAEKKCDNTFDCQDGTDEDFCACADYLKHSHPEAICDGVTDCWDLSDEKECNASCGGGHFYCRLSKACIPIEKKCDNRPDCGYNEDEWDCFTLADSYRVLLDADSRPALLRSGLLAFNKRDHWMPLCMNYTGIEGKIAADACVTLGFSDYEKYLQVEVSNRSLRIGKEDEIVGMDEKLGSCNALYIKCTDVSVSGHEIGKEDRLNVAAELHTPPWNAAVYADGEYKCAGTVLNLNWILTSVNCFPGILKLHQHYVAVLMGAYKGYLHVGGPHEQVIPVTEAARVLNTDVVLLRLKEKLRFSRYVHPLHFKRTTDFVRHKETCVAIGRGLNQMTRSVLLRPMQNCTTGFRCFERLETSPSECKVSDAADPWSGCVVCDSGSGFYPAAVFHEPKGWCGFSRSISLPNIALLKRVLFQHIETAEVLVQPPTCKGFRCNLGECIEAQSMCNGIPDCRDSFDENYTICAEFKRNCHLTDSCYCLPYEMRCANGKCVPKVVFCDQVDDCGDGSDEPDTCNCQAYLRLANSSKVCDGVRNCLDKSDEDPTLCKCSAGQFKCGQSSYCIPNDMVCDGQKDCPENEDEVKCLSLQSPDDNFNIGEVLTCTYGIWHPGCFPEHLTTTELEEICKKIGFTGNSASYLNATASPTGRPVLDTFNSFWVHRGRGSSKIRLSIRSGANNFVSFVDDPGCHRLFLRCL